MSVLDDMFDYILDEDPYDEYVYRSPDRERYYPKARFIETRDYNDFEGTSYDNMLWITKEGSKLLIREMDRFHLENCKATMERNQTTKFIQYQRICEELLSRTGAEDFK